MNVNVKAWKDNVIIPTYEVGEPEKLPLFLEKRVYQGSSGIVYPNPVIEKISTEKTDKQWEVIFIENKYLTIMILPALGGRIQMAYDKIRERHFVYYNHVIKPALVGVTGPWISGGIEFNWPQHHRPSTYDPVDFYIEDNKDGSKTVWVSEVERMFRTKGMAGFTLYPDKAYLEIKAQLYNRTPHPQTFLWWANPAVAVNEHYQSVFPPDVNAVFDHGKRDVSEFPIAKGVYYKVDYSPGTDISRYKNIPVPTSYMAINSSYDFVGGYEHDTKGGLLHVADHHVSPGKKQWTWGNDDFGQAWDRNLTDEDGPYIELMCGVYTDNQPDFSWLHPYEEKSFKQYFMPYYNVGVVKNATKEALLNLEFENEQATVKVYVTAVYPDCTITLWNGKNVVLKEKMSLSPEKGFEKTVVIDGADYVDLKIIVQGNKDTVLVSWSPEDYSHQEVPEPAKTAKEPKDIETVEQLYLRGLHLEQYRHATYDPTAYYLEAISREPGDVRCNNAMGLWYLKKGQLKKALPYFDNAIDTLTQHNPNPYDGEPYFNKGLAHKFLGEQNQAYDAFYKATWNAAWQDAGYFHLAQIDADRGNYTKALELIDKALIRNSHNHKARHLKIILLRITGKEEEALELINGSLTIDQFNFGALYEKYILDGEVESLSIFKDRIRDNAHNYIEYSIDYAQAGMYQEAKQLLQEHLNENDAAYPMVHYFMGWFYEQNGNISKAGEHYQEAQQMSSDYCFPNRLEEVIVLKAALSFDEKDSKASYYLGNFWYAARQYEEARDCWEKSVEYDGVNALSHRNLALYYYNKSGKKKRAKQHLEKAFSMDHNNARMLMELDQMYKKKNIPVDVRLKVLEDNFELVQRRDDLYLERISLYNILGDHHKALKLIENRQFHPWEGGEGKVPLQWITSNIELARKYLKANEPDKAVHHLEAARNYPTNLGEGKLYGAQENDVHYWLGCAYEIQEDRSLARSFWEKASGGIKDPSPAMYYNDQSPDKILYQGLALLKLGQKKEAHDRFNKLIDYGKYHMSDKVKIDYFAVSLPDFLIWEEDSNVRNKVHCHYMIGLGQLGFGNMEASRKAFEKVAQKDLYHLPAHLHLNMAKEKILMT